MSFEFATILYRVSEHVATITLNRPEELNTFSVPAMREIVRALELADSDDQTRAIILTGAGRAFCAGADLSRGPNALDYASFKSVRDDLIVDGIYRDAGGFIALRMFQSNKPIIVAVNGAAAGVGATLPLAADFRLASTKARFVFSFVHRGIVPESASTWFLPRIVGLPTAVDWCLTGRLISAAEALESGLVKSLHEPDDLLPAAREIARAISENGAPIAVALTRKMLWRMMGADHPMAAHRADSRAVQYCGASRDAYEGISAFLEKRKPRFTGSVATELPPMFPGWEPPEFA